jgi:hypothetical protein
MLELMQLVTIDSQEVVTVLLLSWLINEEYDIWFAKERGAEEI